MDLCTTLNTCQENVISCSPALFFFICKYKAIGQDEAGKVKRKYKSEWRQEKKFIDFIILV